MSYVVPGGRATICHLARSFSQQAFERDVLIWTDGYVTDVRYPAFFYKEMQPLWLSCLGAFGGFAVPDVGRAFALCELGCGVGLNLLVSAACHPHSRFVGIDFNDEHLQVARGAARYCGINNVEFIHCDFGGLPRDTGPTFDFVTSHGVWSWISPEQRAALLEAASASLRAGGLFYLHYMCHPGSTDLAPLQHLLKLCAHHMPGPSTRKVTAGMMLLQTMAQAGAMEAGSAMARHIRNMSLRDPADLAHEFLGDHWEPQHSANVHQEAAAAGFSYVCSGDVFNNIDVSLSIPGAMQDLVRKTAAPALAETLKDMTRGAHQRMDLFQKGPVALDARDRIKAIENMRFCRLPGAPHRGPVSFETPIGPITGGAEVFTPLLECLARAAVVPGSRLGALPPFADNPGAFLQAMQLLMMAQSAHPAISEPVQDERIALLSRWFGQEGIQLTIVPECATAIAGSPVA
jgi:ubiquinone/menaquinone biosynthesis C-methylase UbiE